MNADIDFSIPDREEFRMGYELYNQKEKKGPIYFEAKSVIEKNWGDPIGMANGISIIIRGWNHWFANFDRNELVKCIEKNLSTLNHFRKRDIASLSQSDAEIIKSQFNQFLDALRRKTDSVRSPVSVAKALNPLSPNFYPLWDSYIAEGYNCGFSGYGPENAASIYLRFCEKIRFIAEIVKEFVDYPDDRSLLKRIDEYSYSKYTKNWI